MKIPGLIGLRRVKQVKAVSGLWRHRAGLFSMLRDMLGGRYQATLMTRIALVAAIIYVLLPLDFIPDFLPIIGWADDGAVLYFLVKRLKSELERYNLQRTA